MLLILLFACADDRPAPVVDGPDFFDSPWPSETRLGAAGGPAFEGFPNVDRVPLLQEYVTLADEVLTGASTVAPAYFRFDGPVDRATLPDPAGSLEPDAGVFIVNVDPRSPEWARRTPVSWDLQDTETAYQPTNLLAVAPLIGAPLLPNTRYAVVVTTRVARPAPEQAEVWRDDHPDHARWDDLQRALFEGGVPVEDVAVATQYTTQDPTEEMTDIAWQVREALGPQRLDQALRRVGGNSVVDVWEGTLYLPIWQHGQRPYSSEGGGFERNASGIPLIYAWERVVFALSTPKEAPPEGGWPLVLYAHGTGGDHMSCCESRDLSSEGAVLGDKGLAVLGFAQPLHGDRATPSTNVEMHTFNFLNPTSGRSSFRQGALDIVYLATVLSASPPAFTDEEGAPLPVDTSRLTYMGHSQGGITGALALPWIGDKIQGAAISGAGGGLALSVIFRKQGGLDLESLVKDALAFDPGEELDGLHPAATAIQSLTDVTDPLNYSPLWFANASPLGTPPVSVFMTEGLVDEHTPPLTTEALAAAGQVPILSPVGSASEVHRLRGILDQPSPARDNVVAWDGSTVTTGLAQFPDQNHFAIYNDDDAMRLYANFLANAAAGDPFIVRWE